jgi:hypothetical protein
MNVDLAVDAAVSVAASTVQFGSPQPSIILPVVAGDLLYSAGIRGYIQREFGGVDAPLQDEFSRDIAAKTAIVTLLSFVANQFLGGEVDILGAAVNASITFTAAGGVKEALDLQ